MDPLGNDYNFISNPEIDPKVNHYNFVFYNILYYSDSNQLNKILNNVNSVNLQSIYCIWMPQTYAHTKTYFMLIWNVSNINFLFWLFWETQTDTSTETSIEIPGYNKLGCVYTPGVQSIYSYFNAPSTYLYGGGLLAITEPCRGWVRWGIPRMACIYLSGGWNGRV